MAFFEYCTVRDIRNEGVAEADYSDERVLNTIRTASVRLNLHTDQWFQPVIGEIYIDGNDTPFCALPGYKRMIDVTTVEIMDARTSRLSPMDESGLFPDRRVYHVVDSTSWQISAKKTFLEWVTNPLSSNPAWFPFANSLYAPGDIEVWWPEGRKNIKLDGVFGWLEEGNEKALSAETTTLANAGDANITVDDVTGWLAGDVAAFYLASDDVRLMTVTSVDESANELYFEGDSLTSGGLRFDVPSGTTVKTWGSVPLLIRSCAMRLTVRSLQSLGTVLSPGSIMAGAIVQEKVDNYSYKLSDKIIETMSGSGSLERGGTGDPEVDSILQSFVADVPPYFGVV